MLLHREELYGGAEGRAEIIIGKHRNGRVGIVDLHFDGGRMRFSDATRAMQSPFEEAE